MKLLISNGVNLNTLDPSNNSALLSTISGGTQENDFFLKKELWKRSLFVRLGYERIAELLIQNSADVHIVGQRGRTALVQAAEKGTHIILFT